MHINNTQKIIKLQTTNSDNIINLYEGNLSNIVCNIINHENELVGGEKYIIKTFSIKKNITTHNISGKLFKTLEMAIFKWGGLSAKNALNLKIFKVKNNKMLEILYITNI